MDGFYVWNLAGFCLPSSARSNLQEVWSPLGPWRCFSRYVPKDAAGGCCVPPLGDPAAPTRVVIGLQS